MRSRENCILWSIYFMTNQVSDIYSDYVWSLFPDEVGREDPNLWIWSYLSGLWSMKTRRTEDFITLSSMQKSKVGLSSEIKKKRMIWDAKSKEESRWVRRLAISSVSQLSWTLCVPKDGSMPSFPLHHQLPELAQIHVHWLSDAVQSFHSVSSPSPTAFNLC